MPKTIVIYLSGLRHTKFNFITTIVVVVIYRMNKVCCKSVFIRGTNQTVTGNSRALSQTLRSCLLSMARSILAPFLRALFAVI